MVDLADWNVSKLMMKAAKQTGVGKSSAKQSHQPPPAALEEADHFNIAQGSEGVRGS